MMREDVRVEEMKDKSKSMKRVLNPKNQKRARNSNNERLKGSDIKPPCER